VKTVMNWIIVGRCVNYNFTRMTPHQEFGLNNDSITKIMDSCLKNVSV
jgi:hypothetical protein